MALLGRSTAAALALAGTVLAGTVLAGTVLAGAGPAFAASAPTAITGPASAVTATGASVAGNVDANGEKTSWYFEYGTTTGYGGKTATSTVAAGNGSVAVSVTLGGLRPATAYHYRLVATSSAGTTDGVDQTFKTAGAPPAVTTRAATLVAATSVTLNGAVDPQGLATTWYFEYGTTLGYGRTTPAGHTAATSGSIAVHADVAGLLPGVVYHFRLVATNAAGTSDASDVAVKTALRRPSALTAPASAVGPTSATLGGTVDPFGLSTAWRIRYGTTGLTGSTAAESAGSGLSPMTVSVKLDGLRPATTYRFQLVATNAAGTSYGSEQSLRTTGAAPAALTTSASPGVTTATLSGSVDPNGVDTTWSFQYGRTTRYGSTTPAEHTGAGNAVLIERAAVSGLSANTTYHYRLVATSPYGSAYGADAAFRTLGPTLSVSSRVVGYGRSARLSGTVPYGQANKTVTVFSRRPGQASFVGLTTVLTGPGGTWALRVAPRIGTDYKVSWDGITSWTVALHVAPSVSYRTVPVGKIATRVGTARSLRGHLVRLQALIGGSWRAIDSARLDSANRATFHPSLPRGYSKLRVFLSAYQAGPGYVAGASGAHLYLKR